MTERLARTYFGIQAFAGLVWWVLVALCDDVRVATLGTWNAAWLAPFDLVLFVGGSALAAATGRARWAWLTAVWTLVITVALGVYALVTTRAGWGAAIMAVATIGSLAAAAQLTVGRLPTRLFFEGPFRFRPARDHSVSRHVGSSLAQLVVFWSLFLIGVPYGLRRVEARIGIDLAVLDRPVFDVAGVALFAIGSGLGVWSCLTMAVVGRGTPLPAITARELVVAGPYRWVRNPMALAGVAQTVGVGWWVGAWTPMVAALAGALFWEIVIRPEEERDLSERFGAAYDEYRAQVRCWWPTR